MSNDRRARGGRHIADVGKLAPAYLLPHTAVPYGNQYKPRSVSTHILLLDSCYTYFIPLRNLVTDLQQLICKLAIFLALSKRDVYTGTDTRISSIVNQLFQHAQSSRELDVKTILPSQVKAPAPHIT
jgi:hypothetical protein